MLETGIIVILRDNPHQLQALSRFLNVATIWNYGSSLYICKPLHFLFASSDIQKTIGILVLLALGYFFAFLPMKYLDTNVTLACYP